MSKRDTEASGSGIILNKSPWLSGGSIFVCRALGRFLSLVEPLPLSPTPLFPHSLAWMSQEVLNATGYPEFIQEMTDKDPVKYQNAIK